MLKGKEAKMTNATTTENATPAYDPAKKALAWYDFAKGKAKWEGERKTMWGKIPMAFDPNEKDSWGDNMEVAARRAANRDNECEYTAGTWTEVIPYTAEALAEFEKRMVR